MHINSEMIDEAGLLLYEGMKYILSRGKKVERLLVFLVTHLYCARLCNDLNTMQILQSICMSNMQI